MDLPNRLSARAADLGFALCGVAPATDADGFGPLCEWLDAGYAGEMAYLHRHREARRHPQSVFAPVRSVVMLGFDYGPSVVPPGAIPPGHGRVASYAQREDYHPLLRGKLNELSEWLSGEVPGAESRGVVDSAPLMERDFARRAGLGWFGKNTMLINRHRGSFFLLAALLTSAELAPSAPAPPPVGAGHCGTCTRCLDACPTQAFVAPGKLDARRCIGYLTVEARGPELPPGSPSDLAGWLFGCDVCQEVCPWNRFAAPNPAFPGRIELASADPAEVLAMTSAEFAARFAGTPMADRGGEAKMRRSAGLLSRQSVPGEPRGVSPRIPAQ